MAEIHTPLQIAQPVTCFTCDEMIGVIPLGWDVPHFITCCACRMKQLTGVIE